MDTDKSCYKCNKTDNFYYEFLIHKKTEEIEIHLCENCFDEYDDWYMQSWNRFGDNNLRDNTAPLGVWLNIFPHESKRSRDDDLDFDKRLKL